MRTQRSRRRDGTGRDGTGRTGRRARSGVGSGFLGDLIEVFQPSRRHVVAEQERRRDLVQLPESGDPPLIDLDAGIAHLPPPPGAPRATDADATTRPRDTEVPDATSSAARRHRAHGTGATT